MNVFFSSQPYTAVIFSHPCIINDMMSRIRDGNGLIVASWCLTRNRERDVIISTMTSCPPLRPASLALYTVHGTVRNSTGRCSHPLSVRRGPQTWQHPPSSLRLYRTCQWLTIQDLFSPSQVVMYVPGYGVSLPGTGATGAGLCVPQYVTFNPLQHQYR